MSAQNSGESTHSESAKKTSMAVNDNRRLPSAEDTPPQTLKRKILVVEPTQRLLSAGLLALGFCSIKHALIAGLPKIHISESQ